MTQKHSELRGLTRKMGLMMMSGATLHGSMLHAGMIDNEAQLQTALSLIDRMNGLSMNWPGVEQETITVDDPLQASVGPRL
jgi:hypothetical protein